MPQCTDCKVDLKPGTAFGQLYCPQCKQVYGKYDLKKIEGKKYAPPPPPFVLQPGIINPCFKLQIPHVQPFPPPQVVKEVPKLDLFNPGFQYPPYLHFIWFGTPSSLSTFNPVHTWARCLPECWGGLCLWVDSSCFEKLIKKQEKALIEESIGLPTVTGYEPLAMAVIRKDGQLPIYIMDIDLHLEMLAGIPVIAILSKAINFERKHDPPWRLVQVASDIMRIIVLRHYGGAYFDFDVEPGMLCEMNKFTSRLKIPLNKGLLCHAKPISAMDVFSENDIIFADPKDTHACNQMDLLLNSMAGYYKEKPDRRCQDLKKEIEKKFKSKAKEVVEKYLQGMKISGASLINLAYVVYQDLKRGNKIEYKKTLAEDVDELCILISESVEVSTFRPFQQYMSSTEGWKKIEHNFSHRTITKPFYSWGDPGANAGLHVLDASATKIQAQIRGHLVRKTTGLKRMLHHLGDLNVSKERLHYLAESWLRDIRRDYGHEPSVKEIDSWISLNWPD